MPPDVSVYRRGADVVPAYDSRTYYKSVHLEPDKAANDKARKEAAHEEWASRVIVNDPVFKVGGFLQKDRPDACDRTSDILKDPPKKYALKGRNAKLPSGRRVKMTPAPFSIFATGEFKEEERFDRTLRTYGRPEGLPQRCRGKSDRLPDENSSGHHAARVRKNSVRQDDHSCSRVVFGDPRWHSGGWTWGEILLGGSLISEFVGACETPGVVVAADGIKAAPDGGGVSRARSAARASRGAQSPLCRVRAAEHAPRGPFRVLERRHGLAEIVERGASVLVERPRALQPHRTYSHIGRKNRLYRWIEIYILDARLHGEENERTLEQWALKRRALWEIKTFMRKTMPVARRVYGENRISCS